MKTRQFPQPTLILQNLVLLWENGFHNWAQRIGRAPDGRPYFLDDRELFWAYPYVRFPLPQTRIHALKHLRVLLASRSIANWHILRRKVTKTSGWDDPIAFRWISVLEVNLCTIPDKPSPMGVDADSKQLFIKRALLCASRSHPQGDPARSANITLHIPHKRPGRKIQINTTMQPLMGSDASGDTAAIHQILARSEPRCIKHGRRSTRMEKFLIRWDKNL